MKQPIPQFSLINGKYNHPEINGKSIERYFGVITKHSAIILGATRWGFLQTDKYQDIFTCFNWVDRVNGYGVQFNFDRIWKGSEYYTDDVCIRKVYFYKLPVSGIHYREIVPESAKLYPDEVPVRFRSTALAIFDKITKLK